MGRLIAIYLAGSAPRQFVIRKQKKEIVMRKQTTVLLLGILFAWTLSSLAQNLVENGNAEDGERNWTGIKTLPDASKTGGNCFELTGQSAFASEFIPVDVTKKYKISGCVKNTGKEPCDFFLALAPFDKYKRPIKVEQIHIIYDSETVLAEACSAEDKILKVKDGSKWKSGGNLFLAACDVDDSGAYADLPHCTRTAGTVSSLQHKNGIWEVTLSGVCGKKFPAGTKVREHCYGDVYIYPVIIKGLKTGDGWKDFSGQVHDMAKFGAVGEQFWPGTAFVKIGVLRISGSRILFDDISFERMD